MVRAVKEMVRAVKEVVRAEKNKKTAGIMAKAVEKGKFQCYNQSMKVALAWTACGCW